MVEHDKMSPPQPFASSEKEVSPVDIDQLRRFTDGIPKEEKALATMFLQHGYQMITDLQSNTSPETSAAWASAAHQLRGASANLGAMQLCRLCEWAQNHSDGDGTWKQDIVAAIHREVRRVERYFQHRNMNA